MYHLLIIAFGYTRACACTGVSNRRRVHCMMCCLVVCTKYQTGCLGVKLSLLHMPMGGTSIGCTRDGALALLMGAGCTVLCVALWHVPVSRLVFWC